MTSLPSGTRPREWQFRKFFKGVFQFFSLILLIPTFILFCTGAFVVTPLTLPPLLKSHDFRPGKFMVDSLYFSRIARRTKAQKYAYGHIVGMPPPHRVHAFQVNQSEINLADASPGDTINVYYSPEFEKVYFRKRPESLRRMPTYKVLTPFLFWSAVMLVPFPLSLYGFVLYRRERKAEKLFKQQNPRERWVE